MLSSFNFTYDSISGLSKTFSQINLDESVQFRKDVSSVNLALPLNWNINPFKDSNWIFQLQCWRSADHHLLKYFHSKDLDDLSKFLKHVIDWVDFYYIKNNTSPYLWYDMAVGIRAARLAFLFYTIEIIHKINFFEYVKITPELFYKVINDHLLKLSDPQELNMGNHGLFQMQGLFLLSSCFGTPDSHRSYALDKLEFILDSQFTADGIHVENSPEYHFFVLNTIQRLNLQDILISTSASEKLVLANRQKFWFVTPKGSLVEFGDTATKTTLPKSFYNCTLVSSKGRDFAVSNMLQSGYLISASLPYSELSEYFAVTFSAFTYIHKHADVGSFVLYYKGFEVLIDGGKYSYGSSPDRAKMVSSEVHSVVSRKSKPFLPKDYLLKKLGSYVDAYELNGSLISLSVNFETHGKYVVNRSFKYCPGDFIEISDYVSFGADFEYVSNLQISDSCVIDRINSNSVLVKSSDGVELVIIECNASLDVIFVTHGRALNYSGLTATQRLVANFNRSEILNWKLTLL